MSHTGWARVRSALGMAIARRLGSPARTAPVAVDSRTSERTLPRQGELSTSTDTVLEPDRAVRLLPMFQPGELVASRFLIVRLLGIGGMGEVYEAEDQALRVRLALKTVRPKIRWSAERKLQLLQEVQVARRVTHTNVCRIHDLYLHTVMTAGGSEQVVPLLTMELLCGETVSQRLADHGPMAPAEALPLLRQMAEALGAAHAAGVVHRDFKSANVFLVPQDSGVRVVVTDFGLATLLHMRQDSEEAGQGYIHGWTPGYAAPEQVAAGPVTAAADVFSLAVVAHELVTGKVPRGEEVDETRAPQHWRAAIRRCLSPDPSARFATAAEFIDALERPARTRRLTRRILVGGGLAAAGAGGLVLIKNPFQRSGSARLSSLAVLPFTVTSPEPRLFESFTNDLIRILVGSKRLRVVAPYSAARYRQPYDLRRIARELKADALLTGTIEPGAAVVRLVAGGTGRQIWRGKFPLGNEPDYALHRSICLAVFAQFDLTAPDVPKPSASEPPQAAYVAYLTGRHFWNRRRKPSADDPRGDLDRAREFFERAIALEPRYATAFAGLAQTLLLIGGGNQEGARIAAQRAVAMDPNCAEAYQALGHVHHRLEWNWAEAEADFRRALDCEPFNPTAHHWYGGFLSDMGRFDESLSEFRLAEELEPLAVNIKIACGICLFHARRFDAAIDELNRALLLAESGDARPYTFLGASWLFKGERERAIAQYRRAVDIDRENAVARAHLVFGLGRAGYQEQAATELRVLLARKHGERTPFYTALAHAGIGDLAEACRWLHKAESVRDENLTLLKVHPYCDPLRTEPCYRDLLRRMKLG